MQMTTDFVRIGADIGGTFTDVVLETPDQCVTTKILTTHDAPERALLEAALTLLSRIGLTPDQVTLIVHGTTLATNALIERRGARTGLLTTEGFRDVIEIGAESRFDQYDLGLEKPPALVARPLRKGVPERIDVEGRVLLPLDQAAVLDAARFFAAEGVESLAIAFLHSYANPAHEREAAALIRSVLPDIEMSLSSEVSPEMREYERFSTTVANAYVQPIVAGYLGRLKSKLAELNFNCPLYLMLSSGGLTTIETAMQFPVRLVESGPAGGAIFAAEIARQRGLDKMLAFDMGGTTAKICFIDKGKPHRSQSFEVARVHRFRKGSGLPLRIPVIEMVEIGAGGGSIAGVDSIGRLTVGPRSAGSEPGPACYKRGGEHPTVTDADLLLGRIDASAFAGGQMSLDAAASQTAIRTLSDTTRDAGLLALGVCDIVDETMASAARVHAVEQGVTVDQRTLVAFGGAAPLHAARVAEKLGIAEVIVPQNAGVGSAVGFLHAPIAYELSKSFHLALDACAFGALNDVLAEMAETAHAVVARGAPGMERQETRTAFARFRGQGYEVAIDAPVRALGPGDERLLLKAFEEVYGAQYGGAVPKLGVEILTWRVLVSTTVPAPTPSAAPNVARTIAPANRRPVMDVASGKTQAYTIARRGDLRPGDHIAGPALIVEDGTTTVVTSAFNLSVDAYGNLVLARR
jgi:N-methylhydantoinase A